MLLQLALVPYRWILFADRQYRIYIYVYNHTGFNLSFRAYGSECMCAVWVCVCALARTFPTCPCACCATHARTAQDGRGKGNVFHELVELRSRVESARSSAAAFISELDSMLRCQTEHTKPNVSNCYIICFLFRVYEQKQDLSSV